MADTATIVIGGDIPQARKSIVVELVGVKYAIHPPKMLNYMDFMSATSKATMDAVAAGDMSVADEGMAMLYKWIDLAFSPEDATGVKARLLDNDDNLEVDHVSELMKQVTEHMTAPTPPTQPSA